MFALLLVFLSKPSAPGSSYGPITDYSLAGLSLASGIYFFSQYERIVTRMRFSDPVFLSDLVLGVVLILLLLEAGRRILGIGLSLLAAVAIVYSFLGFLLPGDLAHTSVDLYNFIEFMTLTEEGVFGVPLRVSASFVFLFILFGAFLKHGRLGEVYSDLALSTAGGLRGGPAKVAVISSGLLGTISGSATANVSTSGTFTIPMMVQSGYHPRSAAAVEALASTGSQLVPPIMGAAAFIMAELTGISYWNIALAAIIPSILYYVAVYTVIHFDAVRMGMEPFSGEKKPLFSFLSQKSYMFLPVVVIVYFLATGRTILLSAMMAILSCMFIGSLAIFFSKNWKEFLAFLRAMEDGARNAVSVAIPCALAGVIVGALTLTGLGIKFSSMVLNLSAGNMVVLLLMGSLICLVLGMGMPSSAAYITVAVLAIPALVKAGVDPLTAHFFGFYFANLSMITPPVALASYTAAGIARSNSIQVSYRACYWGMPLYAIPFLFVTYPSLLLSGSWPQIGFETVKGICIVTALCNSYMGVFRKGISRWGKVLFLVSAILLWISKENPALNALGFSGFVGAFLWNLFARTQRFPENHFTD